MKKLKFTRKQILVGVVLTIFVAVPAGINFRNGGFEKFAFAITRAINGTSVSDDMSREETEARIVEILSRRPEKDGRQMAETTAFFEGRVLVVRVDRQKSRCPNVSYWQRDQRIDFSLLNTRPSSVTLTGPSTNPRYAFLGATVAYKFEPEISQRLQQLNKQRRRIFEEEKTRYPTDIDMRLKRLSERYDSELVDQIYRDASNIAYWCVGVTTQTPENWFDFRFRMDPERSEEFADLVHFYRLYFSAE